ncbi:transaldolase family protein, partial [Streptococcus suis]
MLHTLIIEEIRNLAHFFTFAGVTSNPTIAKNVGGIHFFGHLHLIRDLIGPTASLHVQVVAKDYEGILADAKKIRELAPENVYIKVTETSAGLAAMKILKAEGYKITATASYSVFQGLLAIEAGADY